MHIRPVLLIWSILTLFVGNGLAQTDSVYSKMVLGSAGYQIRFDASPYARPQTTLISRLKSEELAERAVRSCFSAQQTQPTSATFKAHAKKCAAALMVTVTSGDTVELAFANPKISNLVPTVYLDKLMRVFEEDNMIYTLKVNERKLDSLYSLIDSASVDMMASRDTLKTFCNTPQFRSDTRKLLYQLFDTIYVLKKELYALGCDSQMVIQMFYLLDTAMYRLPLAYEDTMSDYWDEKFAGVGLAVYDCQNILTIFRCNLNALLVHLNDSTVPPEFKGLTQELILQMLGEILRSEKVDHLYNYSYRESETPAKGKTFTSVNLRYRQNCELYRQAVSARITAQIQRAGIVPGTYILCRASSKPC